MKMKVIGMLAAFTLAASAAAAQELPRKVDNVEVLDLDGNPAKLPHWGEKNLMIFYVDPDRHKQNNDFTIELEENHRAQGDNIFGFGVMNLKDAPMVPNGMARNMAKKRTAKNGALVDEIQAAYGVFDGIVINPAAYTHTSVAILDALKAVALPAVEVHLSVVTKREKFRQISYARLACVKTYMGLGFEGYRQAILFLKEYLNKNSD